MSILSDIKIIRSKRKTLALTVASDATIIVKAPNFTPKLFIDSFINKHADWIEKQLERVQKQRIPPERKYQDGDIFLFLGIEHQLKMGNYTDISFKDSKLLFPQVLQFRVQKQLISWYKKQAKSIITRQVEYYSRQMKTSYGSITFSDTKSQWGSCTHENNLQFSWRLIMTPILVVNYVVVHELAHTMEKNHSKDFWRIVRSYCPSYNRQRKWLRENGNNLIV